VSSVICDALASTAISKLLRRAANIIATSLSLDYVLVQDINAVEQGSRFNANIGLDRATTVGLENYLVDYLGQTGTDNESADIAPDADQRQGSTHIPSAAFLEKYHLDTGMFVFVPCGDGILAVFAGRSEPCSDFDRQFSGYLCAVLNMLSLAVDSEQAELVHLRNMQQVLQAKQQWESTLDALPQLMCLIDKNGYVIRTNRTLEKWGLGEVTSVRGKHVHDVIHPDCNDWNCELKNKCEDMWARLVDANHVECEYHDSTGGHDLHCSMHRGIKSLYQDGSKEEGYAFLLIENVSQMKHDERAMQDYKQELEKQLLERTIECTRTNAALKGEIQEHRRDGIALRDSEKKYTCLVETTLTGLYVMEGDRIVYCNNRFTEIFGYTHEQIYRLSTEQLFSHSDSVMDAALYDGMVGPVSESDEQFVVTGVTRDGRSIWLQQNLTKVECFNDSMVMGSIIDITEQKKTEYALRLSQQELQVLSEKLLQAQEEERKRIASELHDSVGQSISAVKFSLESAMREYKNILPQKGALHLRGSIEKLRDTIDEVRRISMNIRPSILDDLGLQATITWFIREYIALFKAIAVDVQLDFEETDMSDDQKVVIFRVIQESMNNISKHAEAKSVSVNLRSEGEVLTLSIKDDGKGFLSESVNTGLGFGLSSMRERVKLTAGNLAIESAPGAGTVIHAVWPVKH
jgi:PAS domain S-box-containing protein